jgi:hypothetical protein
MDSFVGLVAIEDFELVGIELQELGKGNIGKGKGRVTDMARVGWRSGHVFWDAESSGGEGSMDSRGDSEACRAGGTSQCYENLILLRTVDRAVGKSLKNRSAHWGPTAPYALHAQKFSTFDSRKICLRLQIFLLVPQRFFTFKSVSIAGCIHACSAFQRRSNTMSQ